MPQNATNLREENPTNTHHNIVVIAIIDVTFIKVDLKCEISISIFLLDNSRNIIKEINIITEIARCQRMAKGQAQAGKNDED